MKKKIAKGHLPEKCVCVCVEDSSLVAGCGLDEGWSAATSDSAECCSTMGSSCSSGQKHKDKDSTSTRSEE